MARGRMLKKEISESKKLGALNSDSARLLYTWLIPWLDIEGRYTADPDILKGHLFPKVKSMTIEKIEILLLELAEGKLIYLYKSDGEHYLQFTKFKELQSLHPERESKSEIPSPSDKSCELMSNQDLSPQVKLKEIKLKEVKIKEKVFFEQEFESFWKEYPKHKGKKVAFNAWNEHPKKNHNELIVAAKNYKHICDLNKTDMEFIKEPSGFIRLAKEYWKDYIKFEMPYQIGKSRLPEKKPEKKKSDDEYVKARIRKEAELAIKFKLQSAESQEKFSEIEDKIQNELAKWTERYYAENKN